MPTTNTLPLAVKPANRWYVASRVPRCTPRLGIDAILNQRHTQGDFVHTATPIPAYDQTHFHACADARHLQVTVALYNHLGKAGLDDSLEFFFDPWHDHIGFFQFIFATPAPTAATTIGALPLKGGSTKSRIAQLATPTQPPQVMHHLPYADAASTAFRWLHLHDYGWHHDANINFFGMPEGQRYLVIRAPLEDVFRIGPTCGFNITRYRNLIAEPSSWNLCSGNGFVDPLSFGHLHLGSAPVALQVTAASLRGDTFTLTGTVTGKATDLAFELADPHDQRHPIKVTRTGNAWRATTKLDPTLTGRYRLYPTNGAAAVEPEYLHFDLQPRAKPNPFVLSMFYDVPDDIRCNYYTPARLDQQLQTLSSWGINRLHWIHYGSFAKNLAWWKDAGDETYCRKTQAICGDILGQAVKLARQRGLQIFGTFKPFDMGWAWPLRETHAPQRLGEVVKGFSPVLDVIPDHQDLTMRRHEHWQQPWSFPLTKLVLESAEPLPTLKPADLHIYTSQDNRNYQLYRGRFTLRQSTRQVPHSRWTPAGIVTEPGQRQVWEIEIGNLHLQTPHVVLELADAKRADWHCKARRFLIARAVDGQGRNVIPHLGDAGNRDIGFYFSAAWPGWANQTEKILDHHSWRTGPLALAFVDLPTMSTMFEPCHAPARQLWLNYVREMLDLGVDGVDIRILCHHNPCHSWLTYAFAPVVVDQFQDRFGRAPQTTEHDYAQIRRLRGEAITQFLRDAKSLTKARGKKLCVHLECGADVPVHLHTRMQLHLDWRRWIEEGIADELMGKYWGSQNKFIHEQVLPLARRHGVPLHLCDMNFTLNQITGIERAARLATEARAAGLSGFAHYETISYLKMNPAGQSLPLAHADKAIRHAADMLAKDHSV